jgi:hypothetical protein
MKDLTHEEQAGLYLCQPTIRKETVPSTAKTTFKRGFYFTGLMGRKDTVSSNPDRPY